MYADRQGPESVLFTKLKQAATPRCPEPPAVLVSVPSLPVIQQRDEPRRDMLPVLCDSSITPLPLCRLGLVIPSGSASSLPCGLLTSQGPCHPSPGGPACVSLEQQGIRARPPGPQGCGQMDSGRSRPLAGAAGPLGLSLQGQVSVGKSQWKVRS